MVNIINYKKIKASLFGKDFVWKIDACVVEKLSQKVGKFVKNVNVLRVENYCTGGIT